MAILAGICTKMTSHHLMAILGGRKRKRILSWSIGLVWGTFRRLRRADPTLIAAFTFSSKPTASRQQMPCQRHPGSLKRNLIIGTSSST